jgi:hypothetical protein
MGIYLGIVTSIALTGLFECVRQLENPFVSHVTLDGVERQRTGDPKMVSTDVVPNILFNVQQILNFKLPVVSLTPFLLTLFAMTAIPETSLAIQSGGRIGGVLGVGSSPCISSSSMYSTPGSYSRGYSPRGYRTRS